MYMNIKNIIQKYLYPLEISYGSIFEKRNTDYEITGDIIPIIPEARNSFDKNGFQYNQPDVHANSCSAHGTGGTLSDLTGIKLSTEELRAIWEQEVAKGKASPSWGGYTALMIDAWRNYWNAKNPNDKVISIAIPMGSALMYECLDKGYSIAMGYKNHIGYNEDWQSDTLINKDWRAGEGEDWGTAYESGHCIRLAKTIKKAVKGCNIVNVDNYSTSPNRVFWKNNVYGVEQKWINELVNRGIWHAYGYVFLFENDIPQSTNQMIDRKLMNRLENRVIFNSERDSFAIIKNGVALKIEGKQLGELLKYKWSNTNESYCLGVDLKNWKNLGLK